MSQRTANPVVERPADPNPGVTCPLSPNGAHWWVIETPNGDTSDGVCRFCGERRRFWNWLQRAAFNDPALSVTVVEDASD